MHTFRMLFSVLGWQSGFTPPHHSFTYSIVVISFPVLASAGCCLFAVSPSSPMV